MAIKYEFEMQFLRYRLGNVVSAHKTNKMYTMKIVTDTLLAQQHLV